MSFLRQITLNYSAYSLQTHDNTHTETYNSIIPKIKSNKISNNQSCFLKRASSVISITKEGSLTIEAALVIPIFLFAVMSILSFTDILRLQMKIDSALSQCAKELAVYGYAQDELIGNNTEDISFPAETLLSETYVRGRVISEIGREYLEWSPMKNPAAMHFLGSRIMEKDRIELCCTYYVTPFFALSPKAGFLTGSTAVARAFTGYDNLIGQNSLQKEEVVYITPDGSVYHRQRSCHYLDLSIEKVFKEELTGMRNQDGEIYHACELCGNVGNQRTIFITSYGNRYHRDILCSGLRRTVEMVPLSQVGGRKPCSKCGYE